MLLAYCFIYFMKEIVLCSLHSVLKLVLIALLGVWLGRTGLLAREIRQALSKIIMRVMLPSLLIVSLGKNASVANLGKWSVLLAAGALYVVFGFCIAWLTCHILRLPKEIRRIIGAANAFGNSSYLPLPLLATVCASAPLLAGDSGAGERSFAYVSIYLLCHSPLLWLVGFPYLSGSSWRDLKWRQIVSPPLIASFAGLLIGAVPFLNHLLFGANAPFRVLIDSCDMISKAVFPCALLVLGANLSEKIPAGETLPVRAFAGLTIGRLVVMPMLGFGFTYFVWRMGWVPKDPVFLLVLMIEASVPSATNLVIMTQIHKHGEAAMARLLLCLYCCAVPLLTLAMMFFLHKVEVWI